MASRFWRAFALLGALSMVVACGGGSSPTRPTAALSPPPIPPLAATLSSIQANVFSTRCTSCHSRNRATER